MATIAFSVYLVGGHRLDVTYDGPEHADAGRVIEHVVSTLSQDTGVVHCRHGGQRAVLFGRGVAAVEVGPATMESSPSGGSADPSAGIDHP
jgi:hypothetical protein